MTVTLKLKPEVEAGLVAEAKAKGVSVEEYILSMIESVIFPAAAKTLSPHERAAAFETWSSQHRPTAILSDYAISREAMYEGRDREDA